MTFKEEKRLIDILDQYKVICSCGHRIIITNKSKKRVCRYCGRMVYLHEEDKKRNDFKVEMRRLLNERSLY